MAKVNHSYMKQNTFLSPMGLHSKSISESKREFILSELKTMRENLVNNSVEIKKVIEKSR